MSRSSSKVKVIGQSSRFQDEKIFPFTLWMQSKSESEVVETIRFGGLRENADGNDTVPTSARGGYMLFTECCCSS